MVSLFVCQNIEKERIIMSYQDIKIYLTLDKETDMGKQFYQKLKEDPPLKLPMYKSSKTDYSYSSIPLNGYFSIYIPQMEAKTHNPGDIVYYYPDSEIYFMITSKQYTYSQKVGEIENSSYEGLVSLLSILNIKDEKPWNIITFTIEEPNDEPKPIRYSLIIITAIVLVVLIIIIYTIYKILH